MKPIRVQLSRVKGWRMPPNTVKVDRSTKWGNPYGERQDYATVPPLVEVFPVGLIKFRHAPSIDWALDLYVAHVRGILMIEPAFLRPLHGKNLACWCKPGTPCHADVLLEIIERMR